MNQQPEPDWRVLVRPNSYRHTEEQARGHAYACLAVSRNGGPARREAISPSSAVAASPAPVRRCPFIDCTLQLPCALLPLALDWTGARGTHFWLVYVLRVSPCLLLLCCARRSSTTYRLHLQRGVSLDHAPLTDHIRPSIPSLLYDWKFGSSGLLCACAAQPCSIPLIITIFRKLYHATHAFLKVKITNGARQHWK